MQFDAHVRARETIRSQATERRGRKYQTTTRCKDAMRMIAGEIGRRCGANPEELRHLNDIRASVDAAQFHAITTLRMQGWTWDKIADGLGISRPGAILWTQRYAERMGLLWDYNPGRRQETDQ